MKVLLYSDLVPEKIKGFAKFKKAIEADNFNQADVKKMASNIYRAKLNQTARLLFSIYQYQQQAYCLVLDYLPNHEYEKSRFLAGNAVIDEDKIPPIAMADVEPQQAVYLNPQHPRFYYLDKVLSFDTQQQAIYDTPSPVVIIGSAGSGKTSLTLEKMKQAVGDVLYVSHSSYLVQNSRNLYYANGYQNNHQDEVDFLSFGEYLESIQVPEGREANRKDFEGWYLRHSKKDLAAYEVFEEFRGVLTGPNFETAWLSRQQYLQLGVRQSLFAKEKRSAVYDIFEKYLTFLNKNQLYDINILSQQYLKNVQTRYDFVVIDEVQDITITQLMLILKSLHQPGEFMLCGDANQIVHPNFFSWAQIKSLFFEQQDLQAADQALRILQANYRNSPLITGVANRILKLKHARFGSVDKESNYLVKSIGEQKGQLQLLTDSDKVRQQLDATTSRSTKFAVVVMHPEQKALAEQVFSTPLVFSIQEAKGLEYDSIILFNFISQEPKIFKDIARGVKLEDLELDELTYGRAKDKADKSLEAYKFYINALYVAITRAVSNLYIVESDQTHPLLSLLDLSRFTGEFTLKKQESTLQEWQQEAHKLALQGKQEQADKIRERILKEKQVPWQVIDEGVLTELRFTALEQGHKKSRLQLFEYALLHQHHDSLNALEDANFSVALKARKHKANVIKSLYKNHFMIYDLKQVNGVLLQVDKYGVDHRTRFNLTPLMTAAYIANAPLLKVINERGADKTLLASHGLNAWQMLLSRILQEPVTFKQVAEIYPLLAPEAITIQVDGRLEKLDDHSMYGFLLNVFFALWHTYLAARTSDCEGITAAELHRMLARLPDAVLPPMKKRQNYISRYLSENEVDRDAPRNRKLFKRIKRGHYILNPQLKIRQGTTWYDLHQLLSLEHWTYPYPDMFYNKADYNYSKEYLKNYFDQAFNRSKKIFIALTDEA